jgi:sulfonate transport system substrate-binding protein
MRNLGRILLITAVISVITLSFFQLIKSNKNNHQTVRLAVPQIYTSALIFIADKNNYFYDEGVEVKIDVLAFGKNCLDGMLNGKYDLAVAYVTPVVKGIYQKADIKILTELHSSNENTQIIYRKDKINKYPDDLYLHKIGLVKGTNAEFLLSLFAGSNLLDSERFDIIYKDLVELENSLKNGEIAAAIFWQPQAQKILEDEPQVFSTLETPFYTDFSLLIANGDYLLKNNEKVDKIIKALVRAKKFVSANPKLAQTIVEDFLPMKQKKITDNMWQGLNINLGLSQMFTVMLESELKWEKNSLKFDPKIEYDLEEIIQKKYIKKYLPFRVSTQ